MPIEYTRIRPINSGSAASLLHSRGIAPKADAMQDQSHGKPSILQAHENGQADSLRRDVYHLAADIGPRNIYHYNALQRAADHIATSLRDAGYTPLLHSYKTEDKTFANISAELP